MARLGDVCTINPRIKTFQDDFMVSFVPMQNVSEEGTVDASIIKYYGEVKKGFTYFQENDVLFAKITPCMENGKGGIARNLKNGVAFGSTEFHVLRPNPNFMISSWLYYLTSWPEFRKECEKNMTGSAGQKRVPKTFLENYEIQLPELDEQRKIAAVLDKVSDLIAKRRQQLDKLDELIKARFVEMFGDPIINNMSWPKALIGDNCFVTKLAGFEYTQYIHYEDSGDVVMVKAQNVKKGKLNDKDISFISNEVSDSLPRSQLAPGDVVMTYVGANIGDVALIDEKHKYHLAPNVAKIRPNSKVYDSTYFMYMLMFLNSYIMENSADTAKAALGMERIRKLVVCIPPIDLQRYFSDFVKKIDKSKSVVQKSLEQLETLKKALMQEYFG